MSFSGKSVKSLEAKASTKIPTSLGQDGALDFGLWDRIGDEFMVQSNINSWVSCKPDTGSLVNPTTGEISCKMVKPSARAAKLGCAKTVPHKIEWSTNGPHLSASSLFYYWDGEASNSWPTHDPCGYNKAHQTTGVKNPFGAVFIRSNVCKGKVYASCQDVAKAGCSSGSYQIKLAGKEQRLYCYVNGIVGWTLVWRYTFSNYKSFSSGSNHITTIPNWHSHTSFKGNSVGSLEAKVSTTPPTSFGQDGALDFKKWFVYSNIDAWVCWENRYNVLSKIFAAL